ncbi:MAG: type VI secretion system tube protein Hcp [Fibrobacter sp.]|nr:type VI secretion system tube protein Hcp [Fibrobacter sp.]
MISCRLPVKIVMAALILIFHAGQALCAYEFYVSVNGSKQGEFKGESQRAAQEGKIPGFEFSMQFTTPFDASSGSPTGQTVASPVTFKKFWGRSTPQFLQAITTNELLTSVKFEFLHTTPEGMEEIYYVITLTNARLVQDKYAAGEFKIGTTVRSGEIQEISMVFTRLEIEDMDGHITAVYDNSGLKKAVPDENLAKSVSFNVFRNGPVISLPVNSAADLLDLSGRTIRSFTVTSNSALNADNLQVPAGLYFVKVSGRKAMSLPVHLK